MSNKILKHSKSKKEKEEAYQLLTKAADMGHLKAMEKLAAGLLFGYHGPQNITAAVTLYETLAEKGSHKSQTALGFMFSYGIGMEYNQAKALVYYTFASLGGNLISQMILGYRYWVGINVPRNCEAALTNYRKVAHFIANKLEKNEEMPVEKVRLMEKSENLSSNNDFLDWDVHQYYKFLAERGDTQIQKAFYYFLKAAKAGNTHGMAFLGKMFLEGSVAVTQSNASAFKYFTMAAEKGNAVGLWGLGLLYFQGKGVPVNYTEAFKYFHIAAEKGLADAQFQLGVMYHSGSGVRKDYKLAFKYFYLASQNGQPIAVYYLAQMYAAGTGVFRSCQNAVEDIHLAKRWYDLAAQTSPDASIPVFLARIKLEVKLLFSEIKNRPTIQDLSYKLHDLLPPHPHTEISSCTNAEHPTKVNPIILVVN
uniref:SEL1L2 adaptor subunit of ERAD E3 ligase n=1 Tax=Chelydra serpentina TaxID=8475 RepID=A0A8C3RTF1_CHESE